MRIEVIVEGDCVKLWDHNGDGTWFRDEGYNEWTHRQDGANETDLAILGALAVLRASGTS